MKSLLTTLIIGLFLLSAACERIEDDTSLTQADEVLIPASSFFMGSNEIDDKGLQQRYGFEQALYINEHPQHRVSLPAFYIDRLEVSNADYKQFIVSTGHSAPPHWIQNAYNIHDHKLRSAHVDNLRWIATDYFHLDQDTRMMDKQALLVALFAIQKKRDQLPVSGISWFDAESYCRSLGKRLPHEQEWELAARGPDHFKYPWGNDWLATNTNTGADGDEDNPLAPRGSFTADTSAYGVQDMAGNVSEWVADWYTAYPGSTLKDPHFGRLHRIVRGGGAGLGHYALSVFYRAAQRAHAQPDMTSTDVGFRCARDA